jgi:hypothetical protein
VAHPLSLAQEPNAVAAAVASGRPAEVKEEVELGLRIQMLVCHPPSAATTMKILHAYTRYARPQKKATLSLLAIKSALLVMKR